MSETDLTRGLYKKYEVTRVDDPEGKHLSCTYFVLDLDHDKYALDALRAYAESSKEVFPLLANDLFNIINVLEKQWPKS